jgi:transcription initiation factor IIF auxiliary subunit
VPEITPPVEDVKFNNLARYVGIKHGQDWYEWTVYVDEKDEVLEQIKAVEYLLHRTFPNPLRIREDSSNSFACESSGWGEFWIAITVFFKNSARLETSYYLDLSKGWSSDVILGPESDI